MALTAKFTADFSQFESAIKGAAVTVTTFEKGVKNAAADLSKLASSLSGADIQRQATIAANAIESIGGATKLTAAEAGKMAGPIDQAIAKYKALGQQVPPELEKISKELQDVQKNAQKAGDSAGGIGGKFKSELAGIGPAVVGAFSVGAIVGFGKELLALGAQIEATSQKLGISTDAVQELEYAASQTGTTLDVFAGGMVKLQDKLVEGSKGSIEAFEKLNLSIEHVKGQNVDQAFTTVADALKGVQDPMEQTQIAMELFGKAGVEALPAIRQGMSEIREEAQKLGAVMSKENIKALDDFDQRLENTYKQIQIGATKSMGYLAHLFDVATSMPWNAINASIQVPELPAAKPIDVDTGARARATAELTEGYKRANAVLDEHVATTKKAADAAKAHAEAVKALRDQLSGTALQADIKKLEQAWSGLNEAQKDSDAVLKRLLPLLTQYVQEGGKLPPVLRRIYDEQKQWATAIGTLTGGIRDLRGGLTQTLPMLMQYADAMEPASKATKGLTLDGLIPAIPLTEKFGVVLQKAALWSKDYAADMAAAAKATQRLKDEQEKLAAADFGAGLASALVSGFESEGVTGAIRGAGDFLAGEMVDSMMQSIETQVKAGDLGLAGAFGQGAGAIAIGFIATQWVDALISAINADENYRLAHEAGTALGSEYARGFGGPQGFRRIAELAGASDIQIARVMSGTAESVQQGIAVITPLINQYQQTLAGLSSAAGGAAQIGGGLTAQFAKSASLTAENIDRVNALGTILGGVIANTAGRTGDLVGAIRSVGPAIEQIQTLKEKFNLGPALSPATAEVLKLYDTITANEDVFGVIQGLGQVMTGLGDALVSNSELASTFGGELAAQFTVLTDRGVDARVALASMAPALQELWELSEQGTITVDETTQALLNQAEAQGVVGQSMKDANEQILDVLVEIRDLFAEAIPGAIARTGSTAEAAAGQMNRGINTTRVEAERLGTAIGPQLGIAAQTGTLAVLAGQQQEQAAIVATKREADNLARAIGPGMTEAARTANEAIDTIARRRITIPIDFDVAEPPTLPGDEGSARSYSEQSSGDTEVNVNVDGTTLARIVAPKLPGVVNGYVVG